MKRERGSATIEAVVSFTGFLFVLFTLLNIANYCRAQMIISNAVDAAAKELSEYSYFYKMSGLQKFNDKTNANTKVAHDKINNVVSGLGDAYSAFSNAVGDSKEIALNAQDAFSSGNFQGIVDSYSAIKSNAADYKGSYDAVYSQVSTVADNPMVYIKSIAASAAGEAFDLIKSRLIAAPLGKALTAAHLSSKEMSADDYLKSIGVVNGLDGLNFNMSSIFTINEPDSIHLVCYYKLSLMQFMDLELESPIFCKESVVRAWLGGDDVLVVIGDSDTEASSDDADTGESSDTKEIPDAGEAAESTDQAAQDNAEDESSEEIVKGDEKDDKDPYEELLAAMALYEKDKEDGNKQAVIDLCKEMNDAGGVKYDQASMLYDWAVEYGVPFDTLGLKTEDGKVWSSSQFDGSSVKTYNEYDRTAKEIGKRTDLTDEQKVEELKKLLERADYTSDVNIPANVDYIKGFAANGNPIYDWPPEMGFEHSTITSISKSNLLPATWDRYGYMGGSNFSDVPATGKYTYEQRAIPYVENENAYHTGTTNNATYFDKIDAIKNLDLDGLNVILKKEGIPEMDENDFLDMAEDYEEFIKNTEKELGKGVDATYGVMGNAAKMKDMSGGAVQIVTPLDGEAMVRLGIMKETK